MYQITLCKIKFEMEKVFMCGSGSGLGLELAKQFKNHNFDVVLNSRKPNNDFVNLIKDMAEITVDDFNTYKPDIIINNGFDKKDYFHSFEASINIVEKSLEYFSNFKKGTLVNINSFYGLHPDSKDPHYAAAKYGLRGFVESIEKKAFENNIKIINFYPRAIAIGLNEGRDDLEELINADELCKFIVKNISYSSFYLSHVQIDRVN